MKNERPIGILLTVLVLLGVSVQGFGQWNPNGNHIYNTNDGNVGIGTTGPVAKFSIRYTGNVSAGDNTARFHAPSIGSNASHIHYGTKGDWYIRSAANSGKVIIQDKGGNVGIGTTGPVAKFSIRYTGNVSAGDNTARFYAPSIGPYASHIHYGTKGDWYIRSAANSGKVIIQDKGGNVGIGTTNPTDKLTVNGKIKAEEIEVVVDVPADYVFEENYELKSLEEVESYIAKEGHLPEVPSAQQIKANGWQVGQMSNKLLEKIEELTLHLIDQNKRMQALETKNQVLETKLQQLQE